MLKTSSGPLGSWTSARSGHGCLIVFPRFRGSAQIFGPWMSARMTTRHPRDIISVPKYFSLGCFSLLIVTRTARRRRQNLVRICKDGGHGNLCHLRRSMTNYTFFMIHDCCVGECHVFSRTPLCASFVRTLGQAT